MRERRTLLVTAALAGLLLATTPAGAAKPAPAYSAMRVQMADMLGVHPSAITEPLQGPTRHLPAISNANLLGADGPRTCDDWYFLRGSVQFRFSHCASVYYVQDQAKAHARLHLYCCGAGSSGWIDPGNVDSITINAWRLKRGGTWYDRAPQSRGAGPPYQDFYSAGMMASCGVPFIAENRDSSVRYGGTPYLGPGGDAEIATSPVSYRC